MMWTTEWPNEPGFYWFYGWLWYTKYDKGREPKLYMIETRVDGSINGKKSILYIGAGNFLYKAENHIGMFYPAVLPPIVNPMEIKKLLEE